MLFQLNFNNDSIEHQGATDLSKPALDNCMSYLMQLYMFVNIHVRFNLNYKTGSLALWLDKVNSWRELFKSYANLWLSLGLHNCLEFSQPSSCLDETM